MWWAWKRRARLEPPEKAAERVVLIARAALADYGRLLEEYAGTIVDERRLPLPKPEMKACLKLAWATTGDAEFRDLIAGAYLRLAEFQAAAGDGVRFPKFEQPVTNAQISSVQLALERWARMQATVSDERRRLHAEWKEFRATPAATPSQPTRGEEG